MSCAQSRKKVSCLRGSQKAEGRGGRREGSGFTLSNLLLVGSLSCLLCASESVSQLFPSQRSLSTVLHVVESLTSLYMTFAQVSEW